MIAPIKTGKAKLFMATLFAIWLHFSVETKI